MKKHFLSNILLIWVFLFGYICQIGAQTNPALQQQALSEIQKRGLDEKEVRARLQQKGVNIDNVSPESLPGLQSTLEGVLLELENEKKGKKESSPSGVIQDTKVAADTALQDPNIKKRVDQGASVQEAISEDQAKATQEQLPPGQIYGQSIFRDKSLSVFRTTNEIKPPDSYILSTGDEITISIFGASQFDSKFTINKEGYISPLNMPKIFLKGVSLGQAKELLRSRFSNFYRFAPEQFAASLNTSRSITVNIFGEVFKYGSFSLSAINTAFNALVAAGGPNDLGTVRNINVIRNGKTKRLDVYAFMNNPSVQFDFYLEDNDIIHVPIAERVVGISGAVRRPLRYELINGENLIQLIEFAGGLTANAYREVIQVRRFVNDRQVLIDVNLKDLLYKKSDFSLLNGDEISIKAIPTSVENTARIEGAVDLPGAYALSETPRVSDLIKKGALKREARTDVAFLLRQNLDGTSKLIQLNLANILASPGTAADLELLPKDRLLVYALARFIDKYTFSINGAVREPLATQAYDPDSSITLQKAILLAGGLKPDANGSAYIIRTNPLNIKEKQYIPVNLAEAIRNPSGPQNIVLKPLDEVQVLSKLNYADVADINIIGAVRNPGKFQYAPSLHLKDVIILAGGLRLEAARNRIDIFRLEIVQNQATRTVVATLEVDNQFNVIGGPADFQLRPYDEIVVRTVPDFELQQYVELNGEVMYPGRYALLDNNEPLSNVIKRAGGLTGEAYAPGATLYRTENAKGFIVTRLDLLLRKPGIDEDHILKPGDVINVPKALTLVTIRTANTHAGDVYQDPITSNGQINVAYTSNKRAGWYVREYAAGFAKKANRKRVTVAQPNGKINRTINLGLFRIYPKVVKGSVVTVPAKPVKEKKEETKKEGKGVDWDKALSQILAVASTMATIALAISALN
jgi:protein involved in polysaccharide export with SLBB domain